MTEINVISDKKIVTPRRTILKKPEVLAPAGNLEKLKFAVRYGADAVYIGGQSLGLRANADNFSFDEMQAAVEFAHEHGAKVFVATNIIAHNEDLHQVDDFMRNLQRVGIDAIIVADPALIERTKQAAPDLELHLSTQASTTNWQTVQFWKDEGVSRVVLAREVSIREICEIKKHVDIEIEAFVHGAMCISYSGRCVLSNHFTARDSNRGGCSQSCRWQYDMFEELPKDDESMEQIGKKALPMFSENDPQFTMSSKDMCMLEFLPDMIEAGVDSFKIEGRMKSIHYVATVTNQYRRAVDAYCADPDNYKLNPEWMEEIRKASHRSLTTGFFYGVPTEKDQLYGENEEMPQYDFAGLVLDYDPETGIATLQQRNKFSVGDTVEFFGPTLDRFAQKVKEMWNEDGEEIASAPHAMQTIKLRVARPVSRYDMMRKEKK
ncbi:U32 family peptidase [Aneurinibacillus thermoaerophilus]|uniref:Putative protease n=1 Tax=Aneurinibacillus thermoaerophilus TaxID=143495 RepID=A0A1G7YDT5_ANETH|nr:MULTISPECIES: U32 family peptidase [Aneurinibacillus]AMA72191.1 protease [Aneurinibacillus sp. XH2]MED0676477.1 U32 family peptidase [Aneurinibacillus thermoaerophilus]MED0736527.1 U32 family peptidase [Aneurinibacillus thermoaerophilus]MED0756030.1 U32 family peptidase [Aneurinibacillus thermoaerophilus]MED0759646.1 U32 family peptidase [Aneurinibacillus thermoaerophilus]